jgi:hypothetical protein
MSYEGAEQRYKAVLAVISDGRTVTEVAAAVGVSRVWTTPKLGAVRVTKTAGRVVTVSGTP